MSTAAIPENTLNEAEAEVPEPRGSSRVIMWLVVLALSFVFLTLFLVGSTLRESNQPLRDSLADLVGTLTTTPRPNTDAQMLKGTLTLLDAQVKAVATAGSQLIAIHIDWPTVIRAIGAYDEKQVQLTGIAQNDTGFILLHGLATNEDAVMTYAQQLRETNLFGRVTVQTINLRPIPTAGGPDTAASDKPAEFIITVEVKANAR